MARQQEVLLREWDLGEGSEITLANLNDAMKEIIDASGLDLNVYETTMLDKPTVAITGGPQYMSVYHYLTGNSVLVSVMGKGSQVRAEDLEKFYSKAVGAWHTYQYAKNAGKSFAMRFGGNSSVAGISAGITAATTMALKGGFKLAAKGVRALMRDQAAWEKEMAVYQSALGVGDYVIGGADSNDLISKIRSRAEGNEPIAQYVLAMAYAEGRGVETNEKTSLQWFAKAAANGELHSQGIIAEEYLYSEKHYDAEYKRVGLQYLYNLAGYGYVWAIDSLLDIYAKGVVDGVPIDYDQAVTIAQTYAEQGHVYSQMILAQICDQSLTSDPSISKFADDARAVFLYKAVINAEETSEYKAEAAYCLAQMYKQGRGVPRSCEDAVKYFEYASSLGNLDAKIMLTNIYTFGGIAEPNVAKAKRYAEDLIRSGDEKYKPAAYYYKYKNADKTADYKESLAAAKVYIGLQGADPKMVVELREYIEEQEKKIARMSEDERRAYLKEPPKKGWIKFALIGGGVLLAIVIIVAIVSNAGGGEDYSDYDDSEYEDEYYGEEYYDDRYSDDGSYSDSFADESYGDDAGYMGDLIASYGETVTSEDEALELAGYHYYGELGNDPDSFPPELDFDCYSVDNGGYVVKATDGYDEASGEPWVIWSVLVTSEGDIYEWNDGSTDWME